MIAPIQSLAQLRAKARVDKRYARLAILASENLGYETEDDVETALKFLNNAASETSEDDVIEEVNFLRADV